MFVLSVIPIVGRCLAGAASAPASIWVAVLRLVTSVLLVIEKAISGYEINVNLWLGVAVGRLGFATGRAGHRPRTPRSDANSKA